MTPEQLLRVLTTQYAEDLSKKQLDAFVSMRDQGHPLTEKQLDWVYGVAERFGIAVAPAKNVFSAMEPEQQEEHLRHAERVKLPWECGEVRRPLKPPGGRP